MANVNPEDFGAVPVQSGPKPEDFGAVAVSSGQQKQPTEPSSKLERFGTGLADMAWGAGQLAAHLLPKGAVDSDIVDQMVKDREAEYEAKRSAEGSEGFDWMRLIGNIANPANYFLGGPAALGKLGLAGKLGQSAIAGANSASLAPVTGDGDFSEEKLKQSGAGFVGGAAARGLGAVAGRVINPQASEAVKDMVSKGVYPTPGQIMGGAAKRVEDMFASTPFVGDMIINARKGAVKEMNQAIYDMVLKPVGMKYTGKIGREGIDNLESHLSSEYTKLLQGRQVKLDQDFSNDLARIYRDASPLMSDTGRRQFQTIIRDKIINARGSTDVVDGDILKAIDSQLSKFAYKFRDSAGRGSDAVNNDMVSDALYAVKDALRRATARSNPDLAEGLAKLDESYTLFSRLKAASSRAGSKAGIVTPETLAAAMRNVEKATQTPLGKLKGLSYELEDVLGGHEKSTDAATSSMMKLLLLGGAIHWNPMSLVVGAAGSVPYMPGVRKGVAKAMVSRPEGAETVAAIARGIGNRAAPGAGLAAGREEQ